MTAAARQAHEAQNSIKASNYSPSEFRAQGEIRNKTVTAGKQTPATVNHANCFDSFICIILSASEGRESQWLRSRGGNHFANARRSEHQGGSPFALEEKLMKKLAIIVICLLFAAPALAQSVGEKSGVNSLLGLSPSTADFVKEAAVGDIFEIQSSQLAAERADGPTKAFASQMITDHQKTSNELKAMVQDIPTALDSSHQKMLDKLVGLNGADFTKQYQSDQVSAHKDAVQARIVPPSPFSGTARSTSIADFL
jgi:putative membrane protein